MIGMVKKNSFFLKPFFIFSLFSLFLFMFNTLFSEASPVDPSLDWKVLETDHFSIIFPGKKLADNSLNYQDISLRIAGIAEETYRQITPQFGESFQSNKKVAIIVEDFSDSVYGFASALPHRSIRLNLSAPSFKSFNTKFESWLKILIAHEYTHIAHFDMTDKGTTFLRFLLGQVIAPNALQPLWAIEGLAIYNESKWDTGGRLNDSRYEMYLRSDFQENELKGPDQIQGSYLVSWPGGNAPYIYGQSLVHFIVQQFGEEKLIEISQHFCRFPYLGFNHSLKKVLGIDQDELFKQWEEYQSSQYRQQVEQINQFGNLTESRQLTHHKYWVDDPLWLTDSENLNLSLLYKVYTPKLYATIREYRFDQDSEKHEQILIHRTSGFGTSYSLSPNRQYLIYAKLMQYQNYYSYHDLFLFHLESGKQVRLSEGMRLKDPAWHPDPNKNTIVAVINQDGNNNLVLFSLKDLLGEQRNPDSGDHHQENILSIERNLSPSDLAYLTNFTDGTQISHPVWSPMGNHLALSLWHAGFQDIYLLTMDHNDQIIGIRAITSDPYTDISPSWSPDGKFLYFSSDRNSIYNLYAYDISNGKLFLLTNVTSGAFEPSPSPNGKEMAFIQYHSSGYELHLVNIEQLLWKEIDQQLPSNANQAGLPLLITDQKISIPSANSTISYSNQNQPSLNQKEELAWTLHEYSPMNSILPTYWTPYLSMTTHDLYLGFSSVAEDQLKFYTIPFTLAYGIANQSLYYDLFFSSSKHNPSLTFSWQGETLFFSEFEVMIRFLKEGYTSEQDSARNYYKQLSLGFHSEQNLLEMEKVEGNNAEMVMQKINSLKINYVYNDTETYQESVGPDIGKNLSLSYQYTSPKIGSDLNYHSILWDYRNYFPLFSEQQVLATRLVAGMGFKVSGEESLFSLGGNGIQNLFSFGKPDSFPLRGFPKSSFRGNNLFLANLEYRFPIRTIEHKIGFDWASIFLERITGTLFFDAGHSWTRTPDSQLTIPLLPPLEEWNASIGIELHFKFNQSQDHPFVITIGAGKAITEENPFRFYAQTGLSF